MYALGIDLGTTFTAAAVWRDGHAEVASLGSRAAAVPSVVLLREDETILTGEAASRRGLTEPHRVSREFKRRLGDTTPILLGGAPYSAEALMSRLLRWTVDEVTTREGGLPTRICICHPANWGPYKRDLLDQAVRLADLGRPVAFTTEPEAAAVFYAQQERIEVGATVAVYDLGGGTFDAAVLRKTATGFEILGRPEGIERLGGIDFDAAVFGHVRAALDGKLEELDAEDPATVAAVARLREECVTAKEALSSDTDVSIPVLLPTVATEVRLTRAEFESMVRPALQSSIEALRRALRSAGVTAERLHSVLLVGGSSRIPLVAQLVGAELGRPVAVDAHPKHAIALGASWLASGAHRSPAPPPPATAPPPPAMAPPPGATAPPPGATAAAGGATVAPAAPQPAGQVTATATVAAHRSAWEPDARPPTTLVPPVRGTAAPPPPAAREPRGGRRRGLLIGAGTVVAALLVAGAAWAVAGDRSSGGPGAAGPSVERSVSPGAGQHTGEPDGGPDTTDAAVPGDEQCTDEIRANPRWVCLSSARFVDGALVVEFEAEWAGGMPSTADGYHLHLYGGDGTDPPAEEMGTQAANQGSWQVEDRSSPLRFPADHQFVTSVIGDQPKVCARIADASHALVPAGDGYATGNCVPIERP